MKKTKNNDATLNSVLGKTEEEARAFLSEKGFGVRTVEEDGKYFIITCDFRLDRCNLHLKEGKVIKIDIG